MEFTAAARAATALDPRTPAISTTRHAAQRCSRRGVSDQALAWALEHGRIVYTTGARFHFLGRQEIQEACACGADRRAVEKCHGLVILVGDDDRVITVYCNAHALADIRRKQPYDRRRTYLS